MRAIQPRVEILTPLEAEMIIQIERAGRTCYKSDGSFTVETARKFIEMLLKNGHESVIEHGYITVKFINDRGVSHEEVRHRLGSYSQESTRYCNYSKDKFDNQITVIDPFGLHQRAHETDNTIQLHGLIRSLLGERDLLYVMQEETIKRHTELTARLQKAVDLLNESASMIDLVRVRLEEVSGLLGLCRCNPCMQFDLWFNAMLRAEWSYMALTEAGAKPEWARSVLPNSLKTEIVCTYNFREWRHFMKMRAKGVAGRPHPQMRQITIPLLAAFQAKLPGLFDDIQVENLDHDDTPWALVKLNGTYYRLITKSYGAGTTTMPQLESVPVPEEA